MHLTGGTELLLKIVILSNNTVLPVSYFYAIWHIYWHKNMTYMCSVGPQTRSRSCRRWTWARWRRARAPTCSACRGGSPRGCCPRCARAARTTPPPSRCSRCPPPKARPTAPCARRAASAASAASAPVPPRPSAQRRRYLPQAAPPPAAGSSNVVVSVARESSARAPAPRRV